MAESQLARARNLADYLNDTVLDYDRLSDADILEALASLGTTLVEDPVADSTLTYYQRITELTEEQRNEDG